MRWYCYADGQPCRIQGPTWDTPPGLDGPLPSALSSLPIACPKTFLISPIDSTATPGSGPRHRLPPLFNHTLPLRRPGQHLCTTKHSACSLIPPAISERLCPPFPPTTLIAALIISTRETAPKHSARPLATRRHFTTSRPPLWFSEMPPLSSAQKALVAQFVAATGANEKTAQRVRQRCLRYHVMSCVPCAIQSCSILSPCYTTLREEPLCSGIAPSQLSSPHLTCTSDYWRRAVIQFLSAGLSTHRRPLRYLFSPGL